MKGVCKDQLLRRIEAPFLQVEQFHRLEAKASTSIGSFYARFQDKNALLTALYARYDATLPARAAAWQTRNGPAPTTLTGAALWTARYVAHSFRARRNLLRSLALQVRQHPELADERMRARRVAQHAFLIEALVRAGAPPAAAQTALFFAVSICRERILFSDTPPARSVAESDAELVGDVGRMVGGFLTVRSTLRPVLTEDSAIMPTSAAD